MDHAVADLAPSLARQPIVTIARKSVAGFKIREGWPIGCKVTLRRERMYEFLDRLVNIAIPRIRDFRGLSPKAFDGRGNYSHGRARTDHVPRNRLRQNRRDTRARHHDHDHRRGRTRKDVRCLRRSSSLSAPRQRTRDKNYGEEEHDCARRQARPRSSAKFGAKRAALKDSSMIAGASAEQIDEAMRKFQQLPRDASPSRQQRRCRVSGRPHAVYRKFGLARISCVRP